MQTTTPRVENLVLTNDPSPEDDGVLPNGERKL